MDKFINTAFGPITQPHIRATLAKNKQEGWHYECLMGQEKILTKISKC